MARTVTLSHPSTRFAPGDGSGPCPDCGRCGGTPYLTHGGEAPDGTEDASLAGLRCTAEALAARLDTPEGEALPEVQALAFFLARALGRLDLAAGGVF